MVLYYIDPLNINKLKTDEEKLAAHRINILYMVQQAGAGHLGSALSSLDIVYCLYNYILKSEDMFFSSKGHDCASLYSMLMANQKLPESFIHSFRRIYGLPGHPDCLFPGIETNTGSLGMGLSKAQGMSLAGYKGKIYVMIGDGELQEGQNFEAMRNIYKNNIRNIIALVDVNDFQCDFRVNDTSPYKDIMQTAYSLGWNVSYCYSGHDLDSIKSSLINLDPEHSNIIFFDTIKGKGIIGLEDTNESHSGALDYKVYKDTIDTLCSEIPNIDKFLVNVIKNERNSPEISNILVKSYEKIIEKLMIYDERLVVLNADLAKDCGISKVKINHPDRFFEFGISEQDMVSAAGGMALMNKIPLVHSFSSFLCRRSNENIYNNATEDTHIIYLGFLSGILPSGPGLSHTCVDDIELMKTIPGITIFKPKDAIDLEAALVWSIYHNKGPVYISISCLTTLEAIRK